MPGLKLEQVQKKYGPVTAVQDVTLHLPHGRFVCFLGPSGCGKTTLLRLIAGLEKPTKGHISLDDEDITHTPAHKRNFGMVFQSLALFPHLTVGENIAYSLRIRNTDKDTRRKKIEELLSLMQLPGVADRNISQLSGGQRQRVAIARALAIEPRLFLLDEPLSSLDANLREDMQVELRMLQQRLRITTILVTHDQREAMTMSDLVVVMGPDNRVHQMGSPLDIYRKPTNRFVADFIGTSNLIDGVYTGGHLVSVGDISIRTNEIPHDVTSGTDVVISIRPENIDILPGKKPGPNQVPGTVAFVRDVGSNVEVYLDCGDLRITSSFTPKAKPDLKQGQDATAVLPSESCVVLKS